MVLSNESIFHDDLHHLLNDIVSHICMRCVDPLCACLFLRLEDVSILLDDHYCDCNISHHIDMDIDDDQPLVVHLCFDQESNDYIFLDVDDLQYFDIQNPIGMVTVHQYHDDRMAVVLLLILKKNFFKNNFLIQ
jgi:hypothetical protein